MIASTNSNGKHKAANLPQPREANRLKSGQESDWKEAVQAKTTEWIRDNPGGAMIAALLIGGAIGWLLKRKL